MRLLPAVLLLATACDPATTPAEDPTSRQLIYGVDNRLESYELSDPVHQLAAQATVAFFDNWQLSYLGSDTYGLSSSPMYGSSNGLCSTEPFYSQPSPADCTGFLVGDDLIATAGHCISNSSCNGQAFVFGFEMSSPSSVRDTVPADDVYFCDGIVARQNSGTRDWAVVQLDRPVVGHTPLDIRRSGTVGTGTPLLASGHPSGLPLKVAPGATVRSNSASNYFEANLDTYGGNSGSPVVNANTGVVEGILVRGNNDFVWNGQCYVSNVCPNSGCPDWEEVTRTTLFDAYVPQVSSGGGGTPTGCVEDTFDPNDGSSSATPLTDGVYDTLAVCNGDDDWYEVSLSPGQSLTADLAFTHAAGDLDLELYLNGQFIEVSESTSNSESVSVSAPSGGTALLRVYGYNNAENTYDLDVSVTGGSTGGGVAGLDLLGPAFSPAGSDYTFDMTGAPSGGRVFLVSGNPGGSTNVPNCPGVSLPLSGVYVISSVFADGAGNADLTVGTSPQIAGFDYTFYAVSLDACDVGPALDVSFY